MKKCIKCNKIKDICDFGKNKNKIDGLQYYCKLCRKDIAADYRKNNAEKIRLSRIIYYRNNVDAILEKKSKYYKENIVKVSAQQSKHFRGSIKAKTTRREYRKNNSGKVNAINKKRYTEKLKRSPPWLTKEHFEEIEEFYTLAKELQWLSDPSDPLQVDHIMPLRGKNSSGLHVPWNLQILPRSLNCTKSNKVK